MSKNMGGIHAYWNLVDYPFNCEFDSIFKLFCSLFQETLNGLFS
jgi:hypothetical protein